VSTLRKTSPRAIIIALHHPPLSADAKNGGSSGIQADLDACCEAVGVWPDMILSGHAHLYQRFTRTVAKAGNKQTPYITAGSGGFAATAPTDGITKVPVKVDDYSLDVLPMIDFGYLTLECDGKTLTATFKSADGSGVKVRDIVSVNLSAGTITASTPLPATGTGAAAVPAGKTGAKSKAPTVKKPASTPAKKAKAPAKKAKAAAKKTPATKKAPAKKKK